MRRELELMVTTEKVVNEGLRIALRERNAARGINLFLEYLGKKSGSERIYIVEGYRGTSVNNTFEWCAEGVSQEIENLQNVPFEAVEWWYDIFENKRCVVIKDVEAIKDTEPLTYEYLKPQNIHSLITAPLVLEDEIMGFFGVDNPPVELMEHISDIAEMVAHFIVSLLEKQRLMAQMEKLSFEDSLSGVRNRNALNIFIDFNKKIKNVGILYCDVLGLKRVNDSLGHQAGDALIIRASKCLQKVFRKDDIYRVGGDEFLVICREIEKDIFMQRVESLRGDMVEREAMMSLGAIWKEQVVNVDSAIAEADQLMYAEKRAYYAAKNKE